MSVAEFIEKFAGDPMLSRIPLPGPAVERPMKNVMEAFNDYVAATSLPATAEIIDGPTAHKDVVFPTSILTKADD